MYKVTLSMPIYNVSPYVERALLSALNQTFESIEFLIVDDKGTDNSMDIVRRIISEHPRGKDVRIIEHEKNIGLGATRNTAIDNAKGEYLFFLDSDDEITIDCIEILYGAMINDPVDFVAASFDRISLKEKSKKAYSYNDVLLRGKYVCAEYCYKHGGKFSITMWNKLYTVSFLRTNCIRCVPYHLSEDNIFTYKLIYHTTSFKLISDITLYHYIIQSSLEGYKRNHGINYRDADNILDICDFCKSLIKKYEQSGLLKYYLVNILFRISLFSISIVNSKKIAKQDKEMYLSKINDLNLGGLNFFDLLLINELKIKHVFFLLLFYSPNCFKSNLLKFGLTIRNLLNA